MTDYKPCEITDIIDEAENVKTFLFDRKIVAKPGQFVMAWLPGTNEKPFALSYDNGITVKKLGAFTTKLFSLNAGDKLYIRGPYGKSFTDFSKPGKKYLIAGGIGAAPLAFFADWLDEKPTVILGAKTKGELLFEKRFGDCTVATEDGSAGERGLVTDLLDDVDKKAQFFLCGPENMMAACVQKLKTSPENIILSLERYMKCGCGLCGACEVNGILSCMENIVSYDRLGSLSYKRTRSGKRV